MHPALRAQCRHLQSKWSAAMYLASSQTGSKHAGLHCQLSDAIAYAFGLGQFQACADHHDLPICSNVLSD